MKIIGIVNSQGEYEGRKYHNLVLQVECENTNANKDVCGLLAETVKIRYADLDVLFGLGLADPSDVEALKADMFSEYIGAEVEINYNKYGAVQSLKVLKPAEKKETAAETKKP